MVHLSHSYMTTGKTIVLTRRTFISKVMSLFLNMLSRLVITFLPRSKRLLISWLHKNGAVEFIYRVAMGKQNRESTYGHGVRGADGEMYGKSYMETYITVFKIDSQREFAVWLRKLKQGLCINLEGLGWGGRWEGNSKGGDICVPNG